MTTRVRRISTLICLLFLILGCFPGLSIIGPKFSTFWSIKSAYGNESSTLTIASSVQQALDKNPDVLTARELLNQTDANFRLAIAKVFPTIAAQVQGSYEKNSPLLAPNVIFGGDPYNQYQVDLTLNQPLYDGGAILAGYHFSKKDREIKQYAVEVQERTTTESVIESFYTILLNQRLREIYKQNYALDKEILGITQRYYKIGRAQKIDLLQVQTQTALIPPLISTAEVAMETAASQLATLLRDLNVQHLHVTGSLVAPDPKWVKGMLANRMTQLPEVSEIRMQVDQFGDTRDIQMAPFMPQLGLVGQVGRTAYSKTDLLDNNATNWTLGLQLSIPIFEGLTSVYTRQSLASQQKQLEYSETKTADTVSANQIQTEKNLKVAEDTLRSTEEAAKYGRESLVEAQKDWRIAIISYTQYQTSEQAYLTAEIGYYQAKYAYVVAIALYFEAVGVPIHYLVDHLDQLSRKTE
jgi:outer membrane protein TolC